jgi:glycosyltransferase involved in cell wall biosynthesis
MACGTPVITANTSSLEEIAGGAAETIDPRDTAALSAAMIAVAGDVERRRDLSARGLARAREFSWTRTARQMLALYARAAGVTVPQSPAMVTAKAVDVEPSVRVKSVSPGALS